MAKDGVTELAIRMAHAIVLLAVIPAAITTLADSVGDDLLLLLSDRDRLLCLVVLTADTLADSWRAAQALLEADAVELAALATLAITPT